jgi:hypothetical protein
VATSELGLPESLLLGTVRIVTSPRIMADPAPTTVALRFVEALLDAPSARLLAPTAATWSRFRNIVSSDPQVRGPLVPDAWLAALAFVARLPAGHRRPRIRALRRLELVRAGLAPTRRSALARAELSKEGPASA